MTVSYADLDLKELQKWGEGIAGFTPKSGIRFKLINGHCVSYAAHDAENICAADEDWVINIPGEAHEGLMKLVQGYPRKC